MSQPEPNDPGYQRPAWFPEDAARPFPTPDGAPLTLTDYAAQRTRPEPPRYRRPVLSREGFDELQEGYELPRRYRGHRVAHRMSHRRRDMLLAACLAAATASIVGLMAFDSSAGGALSRPVLAALQDWRTATPRKGGEVVIARKSVAMATLKVADATGSLGSLIPLSLESAAAMPDQALALRLTGLPAEAWLTAGTRIDDAAWLLKQGEELGVQVMLPKSATAPTVLTVAAIEPITGELVAPVQELQITAVPADVMVIPAAAAPETRAPSARKSNLREVLFGNGGKDIRIVSDPPPLEENAQAVALIASGDSLMKAGELAGARQFYQQALDLGASSAALKLGETYDPAVFAANKVRGLQADAGKALAFYRQADAAGVAGAKAKIAALAQ